MQPLRFDFPLITNSDYTEELSFQVGDTYFDLTGHSFEAQIRLSPSSATVLQTLSTVSAPSEQGFFLYDPASGGLQIRIDWQAIKAMFEAAYPDHLIGDSVSLYYDLLVTLPGGDREVWTFGYINIVKGVTNG